MHSELISSALREREMKDSNVTEIHKHTGVHAVESDHNNVSVFETNTVSYIVSDWEKQGRLLLKLL